MKNSWPLIIFCALTCLAACAAPRTWKEKPGIEGHPEPGNLPPSEQAAWRNYFERSNYWASVDRNFIEGELKETAYTEAAGPPAAGRFGFDPGQPFEFYKTTQGQKIADIILSFQTPSGGWSKRTDMSLRPRAPGEAFGTESGYIPTFDNKATTTQLRVLALAFQATGHGDYESAVLKGLDLILRAQFPNGGWPQNYPLTGGYHDYITYNDDVMIDILSLLREVADKSAPFGFVPDGLRRAAAASLERGIDCLLGTQVIVHGRKTIWGAQYDAFALQPKSGRAFEPAALASQESARIAEFLMRLDKPSPEVIAAINAAVEWFESTRIMGYRWRYGQSAALEASAGAGPLWARFYEIGTDKPVFGDRDGSVHYDVGGISRERQLKYAWYTEAPAKTLVRYEEWKKRLAK